MGSCPCKKGLWGGGGGSSVLELSLACKRPGSTPKTTTQSLVLPDPQQSPTPRQEIHFIYFLTKQGHESREEKAFWKHLFKPLGHLPGVSVRVDNSGWTLSPYLIHSSDSHCSSSSKMSSLPISLPVTCRSGLLCSSPNIIPVRHPD